MAGQNEEGEGRRPGHRWICDRPLPDGEKAASMLGKGIFLVHRTCFERELPTKRARGGGTDST